MEHILVSETVIFFASEIASKFIDYGIEFFKDKRFMSSFYKSFVKQKKCSANNKSKELEKCLSHLFNKENAKKIRKLLKSSSDYSIMLNIKNFLHAECIKICDNDNLIPDLNEYIDKYCDATLKEIQKLKPEVFDKVFLYEFRSLNEELLKEALALLSDIVSEIKKSETNIILSNNSGVERIISKINEITTSSILSNKISLEYISNNTKAEMIDNFIGDCCFEENLYYKFKDIGYNKASVKSVYQTPNCVLYSWNNNEFKFKKAIANNKAFFTDFYHNIDENNQTIMRSIDKFYKNNSIKLIGFIKKFINAKTFHDYDESIEYNNKINVPKTCYIYGDAGIGKTTFTSKICMDSTVLGSKRIFFMRMRDLCVVNGEAAFIDKNNDKITIDFNKIDDDDVLWLDGLDEMVLDVYEKTVLTVIKEKLSKKQIRFIITSRLRQDNLNDDSIVVRISPFSRTLINNFITKYYEQNECLKDICLDHIKYIIEKEEKFYKHYRILTIPFILYMFLYNIIIKGEAQKVFNKGSSDSEIKIGLYHDLLGDDSYIFKNVVYDGNSKRATALEIKKYRNIAKDIAFEMFRQNRLFINYELSEINTENRVFEFYLHNEKEDVKKYNVEFIHKSFYEYFLAEKLIENLLSTSNSNEFAKITNETFGVNRIESSLIEYIDFLIENKFNKPQLRNGNTLAKLKNNLVKFIKDFCISEFYYKNKEHYNNIRAEIVGVNTFSNYTCILLRLYKIGLNEKVELFYSADDPCDISNFLRINDGYINLEGLIYKNKLCEVNLKNVIFRNTNLSSASFINANFNGVDLYGANLSGADLRKSYFYETNLINSNLRRSVLSGVNLRGANLSGADLREADLRGAHLTGANMQKANLSRADLAEADLRKSNLLRADLSGAIIIKADFRNADYSAIQEIKLIAQNGILD